MFLDRCRTAPPPPPKPPGGGGNDKATDSIQKRIEALQLEAETLGMTARQEALYTARKEGATAAQLASIEGTYRQIETYEAEQKALEEKAAFEKSLERDLGDIQAGVAGGGVCCSQRRGDLRSPGEGCVDQRER